MNLSAVISAYNEETKIEDCLKSVSFADEIILIDNSSSDRTAEIAKKYTSKIFKRPNNPMLNVNKNFGFSKATGDWILSLDADERVTSELEKELRKAISHQPSAISNDSPFFVAPVANRSIEWRKTDQVHLIMGVPGLPRSDPRRYSLGVLLTMLGGNSSSRLFQEVREKRGLAYYVRGSVDEYLDAGSLTFQAGVEPGKIEEAIKVILEELAKIAQKAVPGLELNKAKEYLKGKLVLELEDSRDVASMFGLQQLLEGKMRTVDTLMSEIDKVSSADVKQVASELFKN
mgnify:CR=1 FL=1